jgi:hypothetical protein
LVYEKFYGRHDVPDNMQRNLGIAALFASSAMIGAVAIGTLPPAAKDMPESVTLLELVDAYTRDNVAYSVGVYYEAALPATEACFRLQDMAVRQAVLNNLGATFAAEFERKAFANGKIADDANSIINSTALQPIKGCRVAGVEKIVSIPAAGVRN